MSAIRAERTSERNYETRVANLNGTGNGDRENGDFFLIATGEDATVIADGSRDLLTGSQGSDWFFANLDGDVKDKITEDLEWVLEL